MAIQGFSLGENARSTRSQAMESNSHSRSVIPTSADLVNCKPNKIISVFCEGSHNSESCFKVQEMNFEEKQDLASSKQCCFAPQTWRT
jgi:hypothetical protein